MESLDGDMCEQAEDLLHAVFDLVEIFLVIIYTLPMFVIMAIPVTLVAIYIQVSHIDLRIFMPPEIEDREHIVFVRSVCLFVCLFVCVCLSVRNFNLAYNFYIY